MKDGILITEKSSLDEFECIILDAKIKALQKQEQQRIIDEQNRADAEKTYFKAVSEVLGKEITAKNFDPAEITQEQHLLIKELLFSHPDDLIKPTQDLLPYALIARKPELKQFVPAQNALSTSILSILNDKSLSRSHEVIREYTSENSKMAHEGDLIYWQAWLSAIGFDFKRPISRAEVISFIVQHFEGIDESIDSKLVNQGYKARFGVHKLTTIKRRIASLSVFLRLEKLPNPCRDEEIAQLLKKYSQKTQPKHSSRAITKEILDNMLETCGEKLIDVRDKALLLFGFATGGRRRSEIAAADLSNLERLENGEFLYTIPKSKTDQEAKGHAVPVRGRAAIALHLWINNAKIIEGRIFRSIRKDGSMGEAIADMDVFRIVRSRLKKAGYNEKEFSAHGLRKGFVTEAGKRGIGLPEIMQLTTHKSIATVLGYWEKGNVLNNKAGNLAD